jgi:flagellar basal body rod protein FlgG
MIRGLYTAASGLLFGIRQQEVAANNLANTGTSGYKSESAAATAFGATLARRVGRSDAPVPVALNEVIGTLGGGVYQSVRRSDFGVGTLRSTKQALDLAISGPAFFVIATPDGPQYTRDGHFGRDQDNQLVTAEGHLVLDDGGAPIVIETDAVRITPSGELLTGDQPIATLQLVTIDRDNAVRAGGSRYTLAAGGATPITVEDAVTIRQGVLEEANVDVGRAATDVLGASRAFESNQHVFKTLSETLEAAVRDVGRVA